MKEQRCKIDSQKLFLERLGQNPRLLQSSCFIKETNNRDRAWRYIQRSHTGKENRGVQ